MFSLLLFSQTTDPLSGGAGWVGAGLLGLVLAWLLLKHLPDKDRQIINLIDKRDELIATQAAEHRKSTREQVEAWAKADKEWTDTWVKADDRRREDDKERLRLVIEHCQRESEIGTRQMAQALKEVSDSVIDLRTAFEGYRSGGVN